MAITLDVRCCSVLWLLPPADEVWGKVMFSQVFVYPQEGTGVASQHASQVT